MHAVKIKVPQTKESDKNPCFLSNEEFRTYLRMTDCSQVSDGGAALILASEEGLKKSGVSLTDAVLVKGVAISTGNLRRDPLDFTELDAAK